MKTNAKKAVFMVAIIVVFCIFMAVIDGILKADYFIKSAIKVVLFLILPILYACYDKDLKIKEIFRPDKKGIILAGCLCVLVYVIILGGYLLMRNVFDFSAVFQLDQKCKTNNQQRHIIVGVRKQSLKTQK